MSWWVLRRKIHISWLIALVCAGLFIGVFLAKYISSSYFSLIVCLIISICLMVIGFWRKYIYLLPILLIAGILFGLWRGSISQVELFKYKSLYGKIVSLEGRVKDDADTGSSGQISVRLDRLKYGGKELSGVVWVSTNGADIKRGDRIFLHGLLNPGFGNYAGVMYRANIDKIVQPQPGDIARIVRDWFANAIRRAIPEPESSLGIGYLVGQKRALSPDLILALQAVGLTHIVVASGYNLTILVRLARRVFVKISKYLAVLSAMFMIISFVSITGVSPSMSRAGLIAGLSLMAWYYGRKFHPIALLSFAIALTVIINPSYAWGDLGWQLSFASFAGVIIIAPLMQSYFFGDSKPGVIRQILGETIAAQLATAPIIITAFGQLSNVAVISNLLILPFIPLAMLLTFFAGLGWLLLPSFSFIISKPATWLLQYMINVAEYLATLPWVISKIDLKLWGVAIYYFLIVALCFYVSRVTKYKLHDVNLVE